MLFKNQRNSWNFSSQKWKKSGNFRKKSHNVTCGNPFLQKFPEFFDFLQLRVSTTQKGIEDVLAADSLETQTVPRFPSKNPGILWGIVRQSHRWRFRHSSFPILCPAFLPSSFPSFIFIIIIMLIIIIIIIIIIILIIINIVRHRPSSKSPRLAWSSSPSSSVSPLLFLPSFHPSLLRPSFLLPSSINHISTTVMLVSLASSLSLSASCRSEQAESIPGIFEGIESKMLFKNQRNSSNLSSQKWKKSGNCRKKGHNATCGNPFLQKFPEFLDFLQLSRFYNSKRHWRCAGCSVFMKGKIYLWKGSSPYER